MIRTFFLTLTLAGIAFSCVEYTPKPRGYMRLEPETSRYVILPLDSLPYSFYVSDRISIELPEDEHAGWINLSYDAFQAKVYCSYLPITKEKLSELTEESAKLVERMSVRAKVSVYENPESQVYATLFDLDGGAASPVQFYLTDSVSHFFRGALYYNSKPNADSIAPMTEYLRADITELIQTFSWKY